MHITEFLAQLKREGRLKLKPLADPITYHDPCQISRRGATEDARYLLQDFAQDFAQDFREMTPAGNLKGCCGGGGVPSRAPLSLGTKSLQDQDGPGRSNRRQDDGIVLFQLSAHHGREQSPLEMAGRSWKPGRTTR
jgi:hypothetical protein